MIEPHLSQFLRSLKLNVPQVGHFIGLGLGGLQPPQYGLQDQHMVFPFGIKFVFRYFCSAEY